MSKKRPDFYFVATGIGSVPFNDVQGTCRRILNGFTEMPFWPQFVKRSPLEDMSIQYTEGLPLLEINDAKRSITISSSPAAESELVKFYEHFLAQDVDYFRISREHASGLYEIVELLDRKQLPKGSYIKGQTVGPVTFAAGITGSDGKPILHHAELLEAMARGLAIKALWQVRELERTGRKPIIFLDEPYLSGFGSAFSPIQRHEVIGILQTVISYLRENADTLIGIHCCGNTDWSMIMEAGPDIINFDAFGYMDYFLLYRDDLTRFLDGGGTVAWGIVPTAGFTGEESTESLLSKLKEGLEKITQWGIDVESLAKGSIITTACGMGTMTEEASIRALDLSSHLSKKLRHFTSP